MHFDESIRSIENYPNVEETPDIPVVSGTLTSLHSYII